MGKPFANDRIRIGVWGFSDDERKYENFRTLAELGVDMIVSSNLVDPAHIEQVLTWADEAGVEVYPLDYYHAMHDALQRKAPDAKSGLATFEAFREHDVSEELDPVAMSETYARHPSFAGHYIIDEPGTADYPWLAKICNGYERAMPGKRAFVNLLPMYANAAQLKYSASAEKIDYYDADTALFRKYCEAWCDQFGCDYICTDIYPLRYTEDHKKTTYADYLESIHQIAAVARERDVKFWCCIQTFGWMHHVRTPEENEYRWQCYSMLSFGCTGILLWRYQDYPEGDGYESLVHFNTLQPTATYYRCKPVMWEMRKLSDLFVQYKNLGVFTMNCTEETPWLRCSGQYEGFDAVTDIRSDDPLLFGCFERDGGKAFTVVNMYELGLEKSATVRFRADGKKVVAWYRGEPSTLVPLDGVYTVYLNWGDGVFVTVD